MSQRPEDVLGASVRQFLQATAAKNPTPGGGSVTALAGALAASLAEMALQYTVGKKKYEDHQEEILGAIEKLQKAAGLMQELVDEDIRAYQGLSAFLKMTDEERELHPDYLPTVVAAIRGPQSVGGLAMHILELCYQLQEKTNLMLISDLGIAATLAHATVHASELNVLVNLKFLPNRAEASELKQKMKEMTIRSDLIWHKVREHMYATLDQ